MHGHRVVVCFSKRVSIAFDKRCIVLYIVSKFWIIVYINEVYIIYNVLQTTRKVQRGGITIDNRKHVKFELNYYI